MRNSVLFSGSSNPQLSLKIATKLKKQLGKVEIEAFPNNEIRIRVLENIKGKDVFILQSTIEQAERYLLELMLIADAVKRKGAKKVVAIIPWFGYAPQDKVFREGEPLSSQVVVHMLESAPIDEFIIVDIHSALVLDMFSKPVHHLSAMDVFINYFDNKLDKDWVSVALDKGALDRAEKFAKATRLPLVKFDKTRDRKTGEVTFHSLNGGVKGKNIITFDDYVSTGGTMFQSAEFLKNEGANECYYCITHVIVPETLDKLEKSSIDKLFISDSIQLESRFMIQDSRLEVLSIAELIGEYLKLKIKN